MYGWLLSLLPFPKWIKALIVLCVIAAVVLACFQFLFPWIQDVFHLTENTVG